MKKGLIAVIVLVILGVIVYSVFSGSYNGMVAKDENVKTAWSDVETQYQRRSDLIPNLVETVKGFAEQEKEVLTGVVEARSKASSIQVDPTNLTPEQLQEFQQAQNQVGSALSRLLVTVERYPELKSNQNFLELQAQLEGTENRIAVSRSRFNEQVRDYNVYIRSFPRNLLAGMFGFQQKPQFAAQEGANKAPQVQF